MQHTGRLHSVLASLDLRCVQCCHKNFISGQSSTAANTSWSTTHIHRYSQTLKETKNKIAKKNYNTNKLNKNQANKTDPLVLLVNKKNPWRKKIT